VTGNGLASIYSDDGITLTSNPLTTNALGKFDFYAADGRYDLNISGTGFPAVTLSNIEIADVTEQQFGQGDLVWKTGAIVVDSLGNPAAGGQIRLGTSDLISWRNNLNNTDVTLGKTGAASGGVPADTLLVNGIPPGNGIWASLVIASTAAAANIAQSGNIRFGNTDAIEWRNNANSNDVGLSKDTSDNFNLGGGLTIGTVAFASLGTPANGVIRYCSDCTIANPCASGGNGALAKRLNGAWVCN